MSAVHGRVRFLRDITAEDRTDILYVLAAILAVLPWVLR